MPRALLRVRRSGAQIRPPPATSRGFSDQQQRRLPAEPAAPAERSRASPLATSSRITLEAFLDPPRAGFSASFAKDEELLAACLSTAPASAWLDPAAAYRQLRASPLFSHHLASFGPRIRTLYANLRAAGCHEELLGDLLLRAPDPRALRDILNEEADSTHPQTAKERLRLGLVAQAYRAVAPEIRRKALPRLSRPALVGVSRALRAEDDVDLLPGVFYELAATARWDARDWPLLEICLHLAESDPRGAVKLLSYPLALGKLPGRIDAGLADHPRAAHLVVQGTAARAALLWGMHVRATRAIDALLATMADSAVEPAATALVLEAIRTADVAPGDAFLNGWAHERLLAMAADARFPPLPASAVNLHLDGLPLRRALAFYLALPDPRRERRYAPPSPRHLVRLAARAPAEALRRLAFDAQGQQMPPAFVRTLAGAGLLEIAEAMYPRTLAAPDEPTALALIRAFTRAPRTPARTAFARRVAADVLGQPRPADALQTAVFRVTCDALIGVEGEAASVADLVALAGKQGAAALLKALGEREPALAAALQRMAEPWFALPAPGAAYAASCADGNWTALADVALPPVLERERGELVVLDRNPTPITSADGGSEKYTPTEPEARYFAALVRARTGRLAGAVRWFEAAAHAAPSEPIRVPAAAALLQKCAQGLRWDLGFRVLRHVLSDDGLDVVRRWFGDMGRLGGKLDRAPQVWEKERKAVRRRVWRLQGRELVRLEIENMLRQWERRGVVPKQQVAAEEKAVEKA